MSAVRVLVLDNSASARKAISDALEERGYQSAGLANAAELIDRLSECDAIVLDHDLDYDQDLGIPGSSVRTLHGLVRRQFPESVPTLQSLLQSLRLAMDDNRVADGFDVAAVVKAAAPHLIESLMVVTGHGSEKGEVYKDLGITRITTKMFEDRFCNGDSFTTLIDELDRWLSEDAPAPSSSHLQNLAPMSSDADRPQVELGAFVESLGSGVSLRDVLMAELKKWPAEYGVSGEVLFLNDESGYLEQIAQVDMPTLPSMSLRRSEAEQAEDLGLCAYAARHNKSVVAPEVRYDKRYVTVRSDQSTQSELVVPLAFDGHVVGVLNLESRVPYAFDNHHLSYYESAAPILALLVENETFQEEEQFLNASISALQGTRDENELLSRLLESIVNKVGNASLGFVLVPEGGIEVFRTVANIGFTTIGIGQEFELSRFGLIREAVERGLDSHYQTRDTWKDTYVKFAEGIQAELVLVMRSAQGVLAVIDIESRNPVITERYRRAIKRLVQFATTLLSSRKAVESKHRLEGVNEALLAVDKQLHTAAGTLEIVIGRLEKQHGRSDLTDLFRAEMKARLGDVGRLVQSYLAPSETMLLRPLLTDAVSFAQKIAVQLTVNAPADVKVDANRVGVQWVLENLLLNTRKHFSEGGQPTATIELQRTDDKHAVLTYRDNGVVGSAPKSSAVPGRGLRDIESLCKHYGWKHQTTVDESGALIHRFEAPLA